MTRLQAWIASACAVAWTFGTSALAADAVQPPSHMHAPAVSPVASATPPTLSATTTPSFAAQMDNAMNVMNHGMTNAPMTGDPDHDFAAMMIPHHQGAVDMAKAVLLYGKNPVLRRLAQEIIVTQTSEIAVMQTELDRASATNPSPRSAKP